MPNQHTLQKMITDFETYNGPLQMADPATSSADINGGTIDGTTIGASSASTGAFTTLSANSTTALSGATTLSGNTTLSGATTATGATTVSGAFTASGNTSLTGALTATGVCTFSNTSTGVVISVVDCNSGAIDGTAIGANSASTGAFTTLSANSTTGLSGTTTISGGLTVSNTASFTNTTTGAVSINSLAYKVPSEAHTTSDTLEASESGSCHHNTGATAAVTLTLPTAASGVLFDFFCKEAQNLIVARAGSDVIYNGTTTCTSLTSASAGSHLRLVGISALVWSGDNTGTWT